MPPLMALSDPTTNAPRPSSAWFNQETTLSIEKLDQRQRAQLNKVPSIQAEFDKLGTGNGPDQRAKHFAMGMIKMLDEV